VGLGLPVHDGNTSSPLALSPLPDLLVEERSRRIEHRAPKAGVRALGWHAAVPCTTAECASRQGYR